MFEELMLIGFPQPYGTKNCYDCGKEPPENGHHQWQKFVIITGDQFRVPQCDECAKKPETGKCTICGEIVVEGINGAIYKIDDTTAGLRHHGCK